MKVRFDVPSEMKIGAVYFKMRCTKIKKGHSKLANIMDALKRLKKFV